MESIKSVTKTKASTYSVVTSCGYELIVCKDNYMGGWVIRNTVGPKWTEKNFQTKKEAIERIARSFDA